MHKALLVL